jgi:uncharacterized membrane protein YdjX (TVP38/TMEM64 family)
MGSERGVTGFWQKGSSRWAALLALVLALILLPWALAADGLAAATMAAADALAQRPALLFALVALLLALDPLLPVPSSIVAVAAGSGLGLGGGAAAIFTGLMAGCLVGHALGRWPGRALASRVVGAQRLAGLAAGAGRIGPLLILASRPVPVVAEAVMLLAGAAGLPLGRVLLHSAPANAALALIWAAAGAAAAAGNLVPALAGAILLPGLAHAAWPLLRRR